MRLRILKTASWLAACSAMMAITGRADTLSIGGSWQQQYELMQASGEAFATQYTATEDETVWITGYYENTDRYQVYVNGTLDLTTNKITASPMDYGDTNGTYTSPASAWGSGLFSAGGFTVAANDTIKIVDIGPLYPDPAQGAGEYDAQVGIEAVPEPAPAAFLLVAAVLMAVGGWRRYSTVTLFARFRG